MQISLLLILICVHTQLTFPWYSCSWTHAWRHPPSCSYNLCQGAWWLGSGPDRGAFQKQVLVLWPLRQKGRHIGGRKRNWFHLMWMWGYWWSLSYGRSKWGSDLLTCCSRGLLDLFFVDIQVQGPFTQLLQISRGGPAETLQRQAHVLLSDEQSLHHTFGSIQKVSEGDLGGETQMEGEVKRFAQVGRAFVSRPTPHFSSPEMVTLWYSLSGTTSLSCSSGAWLCSFMYLMVIRHDIYGLEPTTVTVFAA